MPRGPRPVYWKPRYPTRSMRERAWANGALPPRKPLFKRVIAWLRRS